MLQDKQTSMHKLFVRGCLQLMQDKQTSMHKLFVRGCLQLMQDKQTSMHNLVRGCLQLMQDQQLQCTSWFSLAQIHNPPSTKSVQVACITAQRSAETCSVHQFAPLHESTVHQEASQKTHWKAMCTSQSKNLHTVELCQCKATHCAAWPAQTSNEP